MKEMDYMELRELLVAVAEAGATRALVQIGELPPHITKTKAYKRFGRRTVDRWIREGLIEPLKDGGRNSMVRLNRLELENLALSSNRFTYRKFNKQ